MLLINAVIFPLVVLYCTLLASAQSDSERKKIEDRMQTDAELSRILQALQTTDRDDIVSEERARRHQARQSRVAADIEAMDFEEYQVKY